MGKYWSWEDDELIKHAAREGITLARVAVRLKRTQVVVKSRAYLLGVSLPKRQPPTAPLEGLTLRS